VIIYTEVEREKLIQQFAVALVPVLYADTPKGKKEERIWEAAEALVEERYPRSEMLK